MAFTDKLANRGSVSTGYEVSNSIHLNAADTEEIAYTTSSSSSDHDKGTFSFWIKRGKLNNGPFSPIQINDYAAPYHAGAYWTGGTGNLSDRLYWNHKDNSNQWTAWQRQFRDHSAWYHIVVRIDTTQSNGDDRHRLYVNGGLDKDNNDAGAEPILSTHDAPVGQNDAYFWFDTGRKMTIGGISGGDAYLADYHYVDGQSLAPTEFGETDEDSGTWKPKKYSGTHGNNGFHLKFENSASLGTDSSGNGNNFSLINVTAANQSIDTPTNNFCVIDEQSNAGPWVIGGLKWAAGSSNYHSSYGSIALESGKWYWETKFTGSTDGTNGATQYREHGVCGGQCGEGGVDLRYFKPSYTHKGNGHIYSGTDVSGSGDASKRPIENDDIIGTFLDLDNGTIFWQRNGGYDGTTGGTFGNFTSLLAPTIGYELRNKTGLYYPAFHSYGTFSGTMYTNFGSPPKGWTISSGNSDPNGYGNFEYSTTRTHSGTTDVTDIDYYAICTKNLLEYG